MPWGAKLEVKGGKNYKDAIFEELFISLLNNEKVTYENKSRTSGFKQDHGMVNVLCGPAQTQGGPL